MSACVCRCGRPIDCGATVCDLCEIAAEFKESAAETISKVQTARRKAKKSTLHFPKRRL